METDSVLTQVKTPMFTESVCIREHHQGLFDHLVAQGWLWMLECRDRLDPIVGSAAAESCYMKHLQLLWKDEEAAQAGLAAPLEQKERERCFKDLNAVVKERFSGAESGQADDTAQ